MEDENRPGVEAAGEGLFVNTAEGFEEKRYRCPKGHEVVKKHHHLFSIGYDDNVMIDVAGWFGAKPNEFPRKHMFLCRECVAEFLSDKLLEEVT